MRAASERTISERITSKSAGCILTVAIEDRYRTLMSRTRVPQPTLRGLEAAYCFFMRPLPRHCVQGFAAGYPETAKLSEVQLQLNETSLSQLRSDHETGHLEHKIANASKYSDPRSGLPGDAAQQVVVPS